MQKLFAFLFIATLAVAQGTLSNGKLGSGQNGSATSNVVTGPQMSLSPGSNLSFPDTSLGNISAAVSLTVSVGGTGSLVWTSVTSSSNTEWPIYSNTCIATITVGNFCVVQVRFNPAAAGPRTGMLTLTDNGPNSPQTVSLTGNGTGGPVATITPVGGKDFGNQPQGTTGSAQFVGLNNSGTAVLTVTAITITGTNAGDFILGSITGCTQVPPAQSCGIPVSFSPTTTGLRSAVLSVTDDAAGSPHTLALSGTGTASGGSQLNLGIADTHRYYKIVSSTAVSGTTLAGTTLSNAAEINLLGTNGAALSRTGWVFTCDSQDSAGGHPCSSLSDGNPGSFWTSTPGAIQPHSITIDRGAGFSGAVSALSYQPRTDGCSDGNIHDLQLFASSDGSTWGNAIDSESFNYPLPLTLGCPGASPPPAQTGPVGPTGIFPTTQAVNTSAGGLAVTLQNTGAAALTGPSGASLISNTTFSGEFSLDGPAPTALALVHPVTQYSTTANISTITVDATHGSLPALGANHLIVVAIAQGWNSTFVTAVTDGNCTYQLVQGSNQLGIGTAEGQSVWFCPRSTTGTTAINVVYGAQPNVPNIETKEIWVYEVSGFNNPVVDDVQKLTTQAGTGSPGAVTDTGATVTITTNLPEFLVGLVTTGDGITVNPKAGNEFTTGGAIDSNLNAAVSLITSTQGPHTPVWTDSTPYTNPFNTVTVAFKESTCGASLPAGASCSVPVLFTPTGSGTRTGAMNIVTNTAAPSTYTVTLQGTGLAAASLSISTSSLSSATVGVAYSQTLTATGGTTPYTWSINGGGTLSSIGGACAPFSLSSAGLITNTSSISVTGTCTATYKVTDNVAATAIKQLSITVNPPSTALLTGMTPASYTLPSGWTLLCTQDFEQSNWNSACETGSGYSGYFTPLTQSILQAHGGTHSIRQLYFGNGSGAPALGMSMPVNNSEIYMSWWEYLENPFNPSGAGFYMGGGDFTLARFADRAHPASNPVIDYCCGADPWGSTNAGLSYIPQGPTFFHNYGLGNHSVLFDGTWHQWQIHYKPNTTNGTTANANGVLQVWRDSISYADLQNVQLDDPQATHLGQWFQISGSITNILYLVSVNGATVTSQAQCTAFNNAWQSGNHQPHVCANSDGGSYGCTSNFNFSTVNAICPGQADPVNFSKYIDDVIVLYK